MLVRRLSEMETALAQNSVLARILDLFMVISLRNI